MKRFLIFFAIAHLSLYAMQQDKVSVEKFADTWGNSSTYSTDNICVLRYQTREGHISFGGYTTKTGKSLSDPEKTFNELKNNYKAQQNK